MPPLPMQLFLALLTLSGCSSLTEPTLPLVSFDLATIGGQSLPQAETFVPGSRIISRATIAFRPAGEKNRFWMRQEVTLSTGELLVGESKVVFDASMGTVRAVPPICPPNANCLIVDWVGHLSDRLLTVVYSVPAQPTRVYLRR